MACAPLCWNPGRHGTDLAATFNNTGVTDNSNTNPAVTLPSLGDVAGYNPALHIFAMSIG